MKKALHKFAIETPDSDFAAMIHDMLRKASAGGKHEFSMSNSTNPGAEHPRRQKTVISLDTVPFAGAVPAAAKSPRKMNGFLVAETNNSLVSVLLSSSGDDNQRFDKAVVQKNLRIRGLSPSSAAPALSMAYKAGIVSREGIRGEISYRLTGKGLQARRTIVSRLQKQQQKQQDAVVGA